MAKPGTLRYGGQIVFDKTKVEELEMREGLEFKGTITYKEMRERTEPLNILEGLYFLVGTGSKILKVTERNHELINYEIRL